MKFNFFKYIFICFIIFIFIYTIYILYFNNTKNNSIEDESIISKNVEKITNLRFAISNYDNINPLITNNKEILNIDKIIFEPLVSLSKDYKIENILADEISKISDTTYIIKVDNNKKFSDGTPVTSQDVSFTIKTLKKGNNIYFYNVQKILNTEVIDSETIKLNLIEAVPFFEYNLTFPIMSSQYYLDDDFYESNKIPIGTGMYKISSITDSNIIIVKNENWWNKENLPTANSINIKLCKEIGEVYNSFKLKNIDIFTTYNNNLENYIGTIGYKKEEVKSREFSYLALNMENKILNHKEVRQAINYCIDKKNIISSVFNNNVFESNYPLDYGSYLYNEELLTSKYNLELARKVLAENGWEYKNSNWQKKEGYNILKINLNLTVNEIDIEKQKVAENIKNQLGQLGIKVNINKVSDTKYSEILVNKNYEMLLTSVYNSFNPDLNFYFGEDNLQNYKNEKVEKIIADLRYINKEEAFKEEHAKLEQIYNEDMPFISLYRNKLYVIKSQNLIGDINPNNYFSYYKINEWYRVN